MAFQSLKESDLENWKLGMKIYFHLDLQINFKDAKIIKFLNYTQMDISFSLVDIDDPFDTNIFNRDKQIMDYYNDGDINKYQQNINVTLPKLGW
jgi:hypothetical protein